MYEKITKIVNSTGLHARPASDFVKVAAKFKSDITIANVETGASCNAKSIIMLLTQGFAKDTKVRLSATGEDERQAVDTLVELLESGCDENV